MHRHCLISFFPFLVFKRYLPKLCKENSGVSVSNLLTVPKEPDVLDVEELGSEVLVVHRNSGVFTGYHGKEECCYCELPNLS